jgi:hypothetical protein
MPNTSFVIAGYDGTEPWVIAVDIHPNRIECMNQQNLQNQNIRRYGVTSGGDRSIVDRLGSQPGPEFQPQFNRMNLQDAVDYSRHLIRATIDQMRFEPRFATVGGEIDTLALTPASASFLKHKGFHCD